MKSRLLLPLFLLLVTPMTGQVEHAPTPEQCRADANAWDLPNPNPTMNPFFLGDKDEFSNLTMTTASARNVSAKMLESRIAELNQCTKTDNGLFTGSSGRYTEASRAYAMAESMRMANFIQRRKLMPQFYAEDEQGKR